MEPLERADTAATKAGYRYAEGEKVYRCLVGCGTELRLGLADADRN